MTQSDAPWDYETARRANLATSEALMAQKGPAHLARWRERMAAARERHEAVLRFEAEHGMTWDQYEEKRRTAWAEKQRSESLDNVIGMVICFALAGAGFLAIALHWPW